MISHKSTWSSQQLAQDAKSEYLKNYPKEDNGTTAIVYPKSNGQWVLQAARFSKETK